MDSLNNNSPLPTGGLDGNRSGPPSLNERLNKKTDLSRFSPKISPDISLHDDRDNSAHGSPHFDVVQAIPGGVDKARVTPQGKVIGGTTHVGPHKADWG